LQETKMSMPFFLSRGSLLSMLFLEHTGELRIFVLREN